VRVDRNHLRKVGSRRKAGNGNAEGSLRRDLDRIASVNGIPNRGDRVIVRSDAGDSQVAWTTEPAAGDDRETIGTSREASTEFLRVTETTLPALSSPSP
jgi:hypothetical protein